MERHNFRVSCFPGSAEELVRWGGKIKHILTAYFLGNICAKNCRNRTVYVNIIASRRWVFFETQCTLYIEYMSIERWTEDMASKHCACCDTQQIAGYSERESFQFHFEGIPFNRSEALLWQNTAVCDKTLRYVVVLHQNDWLCHARQSTCHYAKSMCKKRNQICKKTW